MEFTVSQIAEIINGTIDGDGNRILTTFGKIQEGGEGTLSFLANDKYEQYLYTSEASAIIVKKDLTLNGPVKAALIRVEDPYAAFSSLLEFYEQATAIEKAGIEQPSFIHESS